MSNKRVVLALGAHTDDIELGAGATLARLKREGWYIVAIAASRAEGSLPTEYPRDTLEKEFIRSMGLLGADEVRVLGYPVRRLSEHRQDILEDYVRIRREFNPEVVFAHSSNDTHQDHATIYAESVRAFRNRTLLGYHSPWNERHTVSNFFIDVTEDDLEVKREMVACYESQVQLGRSYVESDYIGVAARYSGFQSGADLSEGFECISVRRGESVNCW